MNEQHEQWHLSKSVNISQIITLAGIIVSIIVGAVEFDRRITTLEQEQRYLRELMQVNSSISKDKLDQVNARLTRIEAILIKNLQDERNKK